MNHHPMRLIEITKTGSHRDQHHYEITLNSHEIENPKSETAILVIDAGMPTTIHTHNHQFTITTIVRAFSQREKTKGHRHYIPTEELLLLHGDHTTYRDMVVYARTDIHVPSTKYW